MSNVKLTLPGTEAVILTGQTINSLINGGDGDAALLYLYILKTRGQSSTSQTAKALGRNAEEIEAAMDILVRLGLVELGKQPETESEVKPEIEVFKAPSKPSKKQLPMNVAEPEQAQPTFEEIERELQSGSIFSALVDETQRSLGRILSHDDLARLFGIYDSLSLEPDVILHLITHCIAESQNSGKSNGRGLRMSYIEKAAYTWHREGVVTLDNAEKYLKELEARRSIRGEIKIALNIRDREFSETETEYVDRWIAMGYRADAIAIAYDRTIVKTGKLAWKYMDSIISSWDKKDLHSPADILEKDKMFAKNSASGGGKKPNGQKFGEANYEEMQRLQSLLSRTKED